MSERRTYQCLRCGTVRPEQDVVVALDPRYASGRCCLKYPKRSQFRLVDDLSTLSTSSPQ